MSSSLADSVVTETSWVLPPADAAMEQAAEQAVQPQVPVQPQADEAADEKAAGEEPKEADTKQEAGPMLADSVLTETSWVLPGVQPQAEEAADEEATVQPQAAEAGPGSLPQAADEEAAGEEPKEADTKQEAGPGSQPQAALVSPLSAGFQLGPPGSDIGKCITLMQAMVGNLDNPPAAGQPQAVSEGGHSASEQSAASVPVLPVGEDVQPYIGCQSELTGYASHQVALIWESPELECNPTRLP